MLSQKLGTKVLAQIPLEARIRQSGDGGIPRSACVARIRIESGIPPRGRIHFGEDAIAAADSIAEATSEFERS